METSSKKKFQKKHNCKLCLYYSKTKKCIAELVCPLEITINLEKKKLTCPLDESGTCPYANELGTCFGFCLKHLIDAKNSQAEVQLKR